MVRVTRCDDVWGILGLGDKIIFSFCFSWQGPIFICLGVCICPVEKY